MWSDTAGSLMGVALANYSTIPTMVTVIILDDNGLLLGTQNLRIAGNGHTAFILPDQIPLTAGKRGIVEFQTASSAGLVGLGLRSAWHVHIRSHLVSVGLHTQALLSQCSHQGSSSTRLGSQL
jgi:hypothetical protein